MMTETRINEFLQKVMCSHRLAGMAVGVIQDGQTVFSAGFGERSLETGDDVTPDTVFHLASISKLFTATAVMLLAERGKLDLDASPAETLPYLKMGRKVTIRQMLSHVSGFSDVTDYHWDKPEEDDKALERYVRNLEGELLFSPGEGFAYSNIAYEVLGDVIAKASGMSFEDFMASILLQLRMDASTFFASRVPDPIKAAPHLGVLGTRVSEIYPYNRAHAPSSTLHASVNDMNNWALAILNKRSFILSEAVLKTMWQPQMAVGQADRPHKHSGLGWFLDCRQDLKLLYHSGSDVGFSTYFLLVPEKSIAVTVLCNIYPAPVEEIAWGVLDAALGIDTTALKPSVMAVLGPVYLDGGLEAMQAAYQKLQQEHAEEYDFGLDGFLDVASSLLDCNQNQQAIDILSFAIDLFPDSGKAYESLARGYFQSGNFEGAIGSAQRSLELEPDNLFLRQQIEGLM